MLDQEVPAFLGRSIDQECPYIWLDATFRKVPSGECDRVTAWMAATHRAATRADRHLHDWRRDPILDHSRHVWSRTVGWIAPCGDNVS
jgi:hypothetical protein